MTERLHHALWKNFLGSSPEWYKKTLLVFLALNPISLVVLGPFVTGWLLIGDERTSNSVVAFGSREAAQCDTTPTGFPGPLLEVTYSLPE